MQSTTGTDTRENETNSSSANHGQKHSFQPLHQDTDVKSLTNALLDVLYDGWNTGDQQPSSYPASGYAVETSLHGHVHRPFPVPASVQSIRWRSILRELGIPPEVPMMPNVIPRDIAFNYGRLPNSGSHVREGALGMASPRNRQYSQERFDGFRVMGPPRSNLQPPKAEWYEPRILQQGTHPAGSRPDLPFSGPMSDRYQPYPSRNMHHNIDGRQHSTSHPPQSNVQSAIDPRFPTRMMGSRVETQEAPPQPGPSDAAAITEKLQGFLMKLEKDPSLRDRIDAIMSHIQTGKKE